MKNIELKVRVNNFKKIISTLKSISAKYRYRLYQVDTYYYCKNGRFKLREINDQDFELIFYQRPNAKRSKISQFDILRIPKKQIKELKLFFRKSFGEMTVVNKSRGLWSHKHTRVHLDQVRGLGNFLELETVVRGISMAEAKSEHNKIIKLLNLPQHKKVDKSYSDLMLLKNELPKPVQ